MLTKAITKDAYITLETRDFSQSFHSLKDQLLLEERSLVTLTDRVSTTVVAIEKTEMRKIAAA